ncbi:MAG TPA: SIMPL domain-containing protein [Gemmatimonadaceae bacterium]|nr:SIMPL domain-containing protein [Gemmatimonadaceae bacterium]
MILAASVLFITQPALAQQAATSAAVPRQQPSTISVSAEGESAGRPDRVRIALSVQTTATAAAQASASNARVQRAVLDTLKALGIAANQIRTTDYALVPEYAQNRNGSAEPPRITGYTATNTVQVELAKAELVGSVIDAAIAKGANGVNSLQFYISNVDELRRAALDSAVNRARGDAEVIARAAGGHLGRLLRMTTAPIVRPYPVPMRAQALAVATPIEPGEQSVSATVNAAWEFVPDR